MTDKVSREVRSYNMSRIKSKNTYPEMILRKTLWKMGLRYRKHAKLPGKPDIVFPSKRLAVFVDGCFWHRCPKCYVEPKTNIGFWREKVNRNNERDRKNEQELKQAGWKVIRFWEHEVLKNPEKCAETVAYEYHNPAFTVLQINV